MGNGFINRQKPVPDGAGNFSPTKKNIMHIKKMQAKESVQEYTITTKKTGHNIVEKKVISSSKDAELFAKKLYSEDIILIETFWIIALDRANKPKAFFKIGQGGTDFCPVDVKIIAKCAIECLAASVILIHNHPSGRTQPSEADKGITAKVKGALNLFDIKVLDHLILTEEAYFSFLDNGLI